MLEGIGALVTHGLGNLRLELSKENYESCGLNGTPVRDGGRKHIKSRYGGLGDQEKTMQNAYASSD